MNNKKNIFIILSLLFSLNVFANKIEDKSSDDCLEDSYQDSPASQLEKHVEDIDKKIRFELSGSLRTNPKTIWFVSPFSDSSTLEGSYDALKQLVKTKMCLDANESCNDPSSITDEMIKDYIADHNQEDLYQFIDSTWSNTNEQNRLKSIVDNSFQAINFFNHDSLEESINYLKSSLNLGANGSDIKNNPELLQRVLDTIAMVGANHTYDYARVNGKLGKDRIYRDISMEELYNANKLSYFGEDVPEYLSTGICRDLHPLQGYILDKLGVNKENGFRVFVKGYHSNNGLHANLVVNYNKDDKQYNHIINYGSQWKKQVTYGDNLNSLVTDQESANHLAVMKLFELGDSGKFEVKSVIPSDLGKNLIDFLDGDINDFSPSDSSFKNRVVVSIQEPNTNLNFKIFSGLLTPNLTSDQKYSHAPDKYVGLAISKKFKYDNDGVFKANASASTALTYTNVKKNIIKTTPEKSHFSHFNTHNINSTSLLQAQALVDYENDFLYLKTGAKAIGLVDILSTINSDDSVFKMGDSILLDVRLNLFAEIALLESEAKKDKDFLKFRVDTSHGVDFDHVQVYTLNHLKLYLHHLSLTVEGRKKLARTTIGNLYLQGKLSYTRDNIAPTGSSEIILGINDGEKFDIQLKNGVSGRLNKNDPNFKSSADRKMQSSLNLGYVGEDTRTMLNFDIVSPLEYSPYGTEFHTSLRYDF